MRHGPATAAQQRHIRHMAGQLGLTVPAAMRLCGCRHYPVSLSNYRADKVIRKLTEMLDYRSTS